MVVPQVYLYLFLLLCASWVEFERRLFDSKFIWLPAFSVMTHVLCLKSCNTLVISPSWWFTARMQSRINCYKHFATFTQTWKQASGVTSGDRGSLGVRPRPIHRDSTAWSSHGRSDGVTWGGAPHCMTRSCTIADKSTTCGHKKLCNISHSRRFHFLKLNRCPNFLYCTYSLII